MTNKMMISKRKIGKNNRRNKWEEKKMNAKIKNRVKCVSMLKTEKQKANKRDYINSTSSNNCCSIDTSRNNNKFGI